MSESTRNLVAKIKEGDADAREQLYARLQLPVLFLVRVSLGRKLRQKVDSWDIVQEALLKSLKDLSSFNYDRDDAFRRYLYTKVQQVIRDHADYWSAAKRLPSREEPLAAKGPAGSVHQTDLPDHRQERSPSELVMLDEQLAELAGAMDRLAAEAPDAWELVVSIKIVGNRIVDEAEKTGVSPEAIKMRLRRAMLKLAQIYRRMNPVDQD